MTENLDKRVGVGFYKSGCGKCALTFEKVGVELTKNLKSALGESGRLIKVKKRPKIKKKN